MGEAAMDGLMGEIVATIDPYTEADPAALIAQTLGFVGNLFGRKAHFVVEADHHAANLFVAVTGETSRGRKGSSRGYLLKICRGVDSEWVDDCCHSGLSTGEGLIQAVAEEPERRIMIIEDELSSVLRVMSKRVSTLSTTLRNAWDGRDLEIMTRQAPVKVIGPHISIIGNITLHDLRQYLHQTEIFNGFANRFSWFVVRRSKLLPVGGQMPEEDLRRLSNLLRESVRFAKRQRRIDLSHHAEELWTQVYPTLSTEAPGLAGAVTSRAEAQVRRIALIYALMGQSSKVRTRHLRAALEVWRFCDGSARFIFGDRSMHAVDDKILWALRQAEYGLTRTEISDALQHHVRTEAISQALDHLKREHRVRSKTTKTGGRAAELWIARHPKH